MSLTPRLLDHYDWVVLGDHPGALLSASLVAKLGLSVLILPLGNNAGLMISKTGQYLDFESNTLVGLGRIDRASGLLAECLNHVGILPSETELIRRESSLPEVHTPFSRVGLSLQESALSAELKREFGPDFSARLGMVEALEASELDTLRFWLSLPDRLTLLPGKGRPWVSPSSLVSMRKKWVESLGAHADGLKSWLTSNQCIQELSVALGREDFADTCAGLWYGVNSSLPEVMSQSETVRVLSLSRVCASFKGGLPYYKDFLYRLAKRQGAHIPEKSECRRIFVTGGKFVGVQIGNRGNMISAGGGIAGCSVAHVKNQLSSSGRGHGHRLKTAPKPVGWRFTLSVTVSNEAIPPGMGYRIIWKEAGAPVLEIERVDPSDYRANDPEHQIVFLRTVLPFSPETLDIGYQRQIAARMLRQLLEVMPFVDYHIGRIFPDFRISGEQNELSEIYGFALPELIPENLRLYAGKGLGSESGIEGLFLASGESYPELGTLGGTVAALESTAWIAHRSGLAGPLA